MASITKPKRAGGWGLLDMRTFGTTLLCKTMWRGLYEEGIWSNTIQEKYLGRKNISFWYSKGRIGSSHRSSIWLSLHKIERLFLENLIWSFQSGKKILIGKDVFLSGTEEISIPESLLTFLHRKGILFWDSLITRWQGPIPI